MKKRFLLYLILLITLGTVVFLKYSSFFKKPIAKLEIIKSFTFSEENALKEWEEKIFKGKVKYVVEHNKEYYVKGESIKTASALFYKVKIDMSEKPILSWKWKIKKFPTKEKPERLDIKDSDDFAVRIYVIFPAAFFLNSKVLEYVWAEYAPSGTIESSPYSKNIKLFILRSGNALDNEFIYEERNLYEDYIKAFGMPPKMQIGAIAFMTDADSTGSEAIGEYADIKLSKTLSLK